MKKNVSVIFAGESAIFFKMDKPVAECVVYEVSVDNGSLVVSGEYYGHRLPYDDLDRLVDINKPLAIEIGELLRENYSEHPVGALYLRELEEMISE